MGRDPLARLLNPAQGGWPSWFPAQRFPRMLSAVPGEQGAPQGLEQIALKHLRAALHEAPQSRERLRQVFSPRLLEQELQAIRERGLSYEGRRWHPSSAGVYSEPYLRAQGGQALHRAQEEPEGFLYDPRSGARFSLPGALLDLDCYPGAILSLEGRRFMVDRGARGAERALSPAPEAHSAPIRRGRGQLPPGETLEQRFHSFGGAQELGIQRGRVQLELSHLGWRHFDLEGELMNQERLDWPRVLSPFNTQAVLLSFPGQNPAILHTLSHLLREILDYFYLRASRSIALSYVGADEIVPGGLLLYDKHPEGLGFVDDMDSGEDWHALLRAAYEILGACSCERHCPRCCESVTCSFLERDEALDRPGSLAVLETLLDI